MAYLPVPNQSVSGTVGASIIGTVPVVQSGVNITSISGIPQVSVHGVVTTNQSGTVIVSVMNLVPSSMLVGASLIGLSPVEVKNTNLNVSGSVAAHQATSPWIITGSVQTNVQTGNSSVQVLNFPANQSVSGTVGASVIGTVPITQSGTIAASVLNITPSSLLVGASIFGQLPSGTATLGSVATLQGTNPWTVATGSSSVITIVQGSVGAAVTNVPQASVHGTVKIFPASAVSGHGSVNGAASVQVLPAPGAGLHNYVTDFLLSNTGSATTLVTFTDGDGSVIGKSIAPAGGGAIATGLITPMRTMQTNKVVNIVAETATSTLHAWLGGYKAP